MPGPESTDVVAGDETAVRLGDEVDLVLGVRVPPTDLAREVVRHGPHRVLGVLGDDLTAGDARGVRAHRLGVSCAGATPRARLAPIDTNPSCHTLRPLGPIRECHGPVTARVAPTPDRAVPARNNSTDSGGRRPCRSIPDRPSFAGVPPRGWSTSFPTTTRIHHLSCLHRAERKTNGPTKGVRMHSTKRMWTVGAVALSSALVLGACSGAGGGSSGSGSAASGGNVTLNLATVNNGQMKDMEKLKTEYEKAQPRHHRELPGHGGGRPAQRGHRRRGQRGRPVRHRHHRRLRDAAVGRQPLADRPHRQPRRGPGLRRRRPPPAGRGVALTNDGKLYAVPFYGESSILMYNKEVLDKAGVTMPRTRPGSRSPTRPRRSRPRTWPASACAASPAGATCSHR